MKTIQEIQAEFISAFTEIQDPLLQYEFLLQIGSQMAPYPEECRDEQHLISGCQSKVWIACELEGERIRIFMDSEALIIKGIIAVAVEMFQGQSACDVACAEVTYISQTDLKNQISVDRFRGVHSVIQAIQDFAASVNKLEPW